MKNLILIIVLILSYNVNAQMLVIDVEDGFSGIQFRKIDCFCDSCYTENWRLSIKDGLLSLDLDEHQIYHLTFDEKHDFVFRIHYLDDTFVSLDEIDIMCDCTYDIVDNRLIVKF